METLREQLIKEERAKKLKDNLIGIFFAFLAAALMVGFILLEVFGNIVGGYIIAAACIVMIACYIYYIIRKGGT